MHRLAQLAHGASLQSERAGIDEGLLADAYRRAGRARGRPPGGSRRRPTARPASRVAAPDPGSGQDLGGGSVGRDRVGRDHGGATDDPVGEHAARGEGERLVGPQQERRERVGAVGVEDGPRRPALVLKMVVGGRGGANERAQRQDADRGRAGDEDVDEDAPVVGQARAGGRRERVGHRVVQDLGQDMARGVADRRRADDRAGRQSPRDDGGEGDRRTGAVGAAEPEGSASEGEHERQRGLDGRLAETAAASVERRQRDQADDRQRHGRASPSPQPWGQRQQGGPDDERERVMAEREARIPRHGEPAAGVRRDAVESEAHRLCGKHRDRYRGRLPDRQKPDMRAHAAILDCLRPPKQAVAPKQPARKPSLTLQKHYAPGPNHSPRLRQSPISPPDG